MADRRTRGRAPRTAKPPDPPAGDLLRVLIEGALDGILAFDRDRRVTVWNPALVGLTGVPATMALGRDVFEVLPCLRAGGGDRRVQAALAGRPAASRVRLDRTPATGRGGGLNARYHPLRATGGGVLGAVALIRDVTERQRAEEELRERERQLHEAQRIARVGHWRWLCDGDEATWSPEIYRIFGVDPKTFIPSFDAFMAFVHPDDRDAVAEVLRRTLGQGTAYRHEFRIRRRDGEVRYLAGEGRCELDEAGRVRALFGISQDISAQKRAEAALQGVKDEAERNARLLQTTLENISEGFALYDAEGRLVLCNDTYRHKMFRDLAGMLVPGMRFEDLVRARAERGIPPEAIGRVDHWVRERMAHFWHPTGPVERRCPDGGWWQLNEQRTRDGGVVQVATEITGLKRREAELRASERRFKDFAESASDWLWETDAELRFSYVSERFREVMGGDPAARLGRRWEELFCLQVEGVGREAHLADLAARRPFRDFSFSAVDGRGRRLACQVSGRPLFDEAGTFVGYRGTARDITERVEAEARIRHLAGHDALTGLPNRLLFSERLEQALVAARRSGTSVAVHSLDLSDFKGINDGLGHAAGDELLRQVAARLLETLRATDTAARLGGDEFAVIQTEVKGFGAAAGLARRLLRRLADAFVLEGQELRVAASIGITLYPEDGTSQAELLRNADLALYRAKSDGAHSFQFFLPEMTEALRRRQQLEHDLRRALEDNRLAVHYHPQVELATGRIVGLEALLRWSHPDHGDIPPALFVRVAEECGLILPLGRWVLREACRQARAWQDRRLPPVRVAVNLSPVQFTQGDLVGDVVRALDEARLPPERLELEITEGTLMGDTEAAVATLRRLHALGVVLALDDFGTGYSSLSYLQRFPLHRVKIDQSFVRGIGETPGDAIITNAVITLGHALGLAAIAEGVETAEQLEYLRRQGCDEAQGFYFTRPLPAAACAELLAEPVRPAWAGAPAPPALVAGAR